MFSHIDTYWNKKWKSVRSVERWRVAGSVTCHTSCVWKGWPLPIFLISVLALQLLWVVLVWFEICSSRWSCCAGTQDRVGFKVFCCGWSGMLELIAGWTQRFVGWSGFFCYRHLKTHLIVQGWFINEFYDLDTYDLTFIFETLSIFTQEAWKMSALYIILQLLNLTLWRTPGVHWTPGVILSYISQQSIREIISNFCNSSNFHPSTCSYALRKYIREGSREKHRERLLGHI